MCADELVTGRLGRAIPWEQTGLQAKLAPDAGFVLYGEGTHVLNNMPAVVRPMPADWMAGHLA